jgi:alkyldihydroxyacetonephosphate synthase
VPASHLAPELARLTSPARVSTTPPDRLAYARDLWPRGLIEVAEGRAPAHPPDAVVWPETVAEVQAIVRLAAERGVPIVPFGAGSGVCGGTLPLKGGLVVDVKRMRRLLSIDPGPPGSLTATFECGILGEHLEHELNRRGYTLGHFPSSIMCSTLGGWLAARSAGQCSSRYGKIEDMVRSVELVDGRGQVIDTAGSRRANALNQLLVGSEGTLGIFTRATLAIHRAPEVRLMRGFAVPRLAAGCEAIRRVMQRGLRPSVVRLYDELDTLLARRSSVPDKEHAPSREPPPEPEGPDPADLSLGQWISRIAGSDGRRAISDLRRRITGAALGRTGLLNRAADLVLPRLGGGCLLIVGCEGDRALAEAEARATFREIEAAGGRDLGPGPGERWLAHRYDVSFKLPKIFEVGGWADTMEVATSWERLLELYRAVREAVAPHAFIMAHFSHAYADGCSIYFTFAAQSPPGLGERRYDEAWRAAMAAVTAAGGTISHHHGVGLSKAAFMPAEHGESLAIYRGLKQVLDPQGIFNPGKMGL